MTSYYIDNSGIYASSGRTLINPPHGVTALDWLMLDAPKISKLFYDLDPCVASLVRMTLNETQAKELHDKEKVWVSGFKLTYYPTRFFAIDKDKSFVNFGNMVRYKSDVHYSPDDTIQDKIDKAKEAEDIAIEARAVLKDLGLEPDKIISPVGAVVDKYVRSLNPPTVDDIPEEVGELAYATIKGNWLEGYQLGYWDEALDYDRNGAYGFELSKLYDFRRGKWVKDSVMPDDAVYGFAEGTLETIVPFHPFIMKQGTEYSYTPIGSRPDVLDKGFIDLLHKHKLGTFSNIKRAWWWIPDRGKALYQPLKGIVTHLYNIRAKSEGLRRTIIRQMIAGIWGRMVEVRKEKLGYLFNPVWGSLVENGNKAYVADTCLSAGIVPLQIAVDGLITDKPLPVVESTAMGSWRLSHKGKCIIVSSGAVGFEGKEGAEEFALKYEWLHDELASHPEKSEYTMEKYSPMTLAKALQIGAYDKLGELQMTNRSVIIGRDYKRLWKDYPHNGGELLTHKYTSSPVDTVMIGGFANDSSRS